MLRYRDKVELGDLLTLREAEEIEEMLMQYGAVERDGRIIRFTLTSDGDLWEVCEMAYMLAGELESRNVPYVPNRDYVEGEV